MFFKKILNNIFKIEQKNAHTIITFLGMKCSFRYFGIIQLKLCCDIEDWNYIKKQRPTFTHPIGIVINKGVRIGKNCIIRQNTTIGRGNYKENTKRDYPILGDDVNIGANTTIIGGITIGDNVTIGKALLWSKMFLQMSLLREIRHEFCTQSPTIRIKKIL